MTSIARAPGAGAGSAAVDDARVEVDLRDAFPNGVALEDFTRFTDSLEVRVSRAYWRKRGDRAFTNREVPNDITNDGVRAARAADVLFAHCEQADSAGTPGAPVRVLEMGVGLGLFARLLIRRFSALCDRAGRDFHTRLVYYASDYSPSNLSDIERRGTLAEFGDRVRLGVLDAMEPSVFTPLRSAGPVRADGAQTEALDGGIDAVFHNYLYDVLPQSLLLRHRGRWYELCVQTILSEPWRLPEFTSRPFDELMDLINRNAAEGVDALSEAYALIEVERSFFPVELDEIAHGPVAQRFADQVLQPYVDRALGPQRQVRMWLPWGAMTSLERTAGVLAPGGFMMFTDYGQSSAAEVTRARGYQRYGAGICIPVNFPVLDGFARRLGYRLTVPDGDQRLSLHARLVTSRAVPRTESRFAEMFAARDFETLEGHLRSARQTAARDVPLALSSFRQASELFPDDWMLLGEWAHVESSLAHAPAKALEIVERALELNPTCSADLWCEKGDALHLLGQTEAAERAYRRGVDIGPEHSRSLYNLAWIRAERGAHTEALDIIGRALSLDAEGRHTAMLLEKQKEIIEQRTARSEADRHRGRLRGV